MKAKELEQTEMQHTPDKNSNTNTSPDNSPQRTNVLQVADKPIQPIVIGSTDSPARKPLKEIFILYVHETSILASFVYLILIIFSFIKLH
jgi:hypothetical protein